MDPLSIAAACTGFITIVQGTIPYLHDVWKAPEERQEFEKAFKDIESRLTSLRDRVEQTQVHYSKQPASNGPFASPRRNDIFTRTKKINAPQGDLTKLENMLYSICINVGHNDGSKIREYTKRLGWKWKKSEYRRIQEEILLQIDSIFQKLSDDNAQLNYSTYIGVESLVKDKDEKRTIELLNWIAPHSLEAPPSSNFIATAEHSFVRSDSRYNQWVEDATWQLNCYGRPGSGKSVRAQSVVADLMRRFGNAGPPVISVFFHHKNETHQSLQNVLCSILRQLICSSSRWPVKIPQDILDLWETRRLSGKHGLTEDEARNILYKELSQFPTKYLVIDAIDEAEGCKPLIDEEVRRLRHQDVCIFSTDKRDPRESSDQIRCKGCAEGPFFLYWRCKLCTGWMKGKFDLCRNCYKNEGRRCGNSDHEMKPPLKLNLEVEPSQQELESFVRQVLKDELNGGDVGDDDEDIFGGQMTMLSALKQELGSDFFATLPTKVSTLSERNFLYADMFMKRLRVQRTLDGAISLVDQLDHGTLYGLDEQFDDMLGLCINGVDKVGAKIAYDYLSLVTSAVDVLSFAQLTHARAIACGDRSLKDFTPRCCSKQVIRRETNGLLAIEDRGIADTFPVAFFHQSLSTYIDINRSKWFPDANQRMFEACSSYIGLEIFRKPFQSLSELDSATKEYPFASYAASYWGFHAKAVSTSVQNISLMMDLLADDGRRACMIQIAWRVQSRPESKWDVMGGITPLHACAFYGLKHFCRLLLPFVSSVDTGDENYNQTALMYACRKGHADVVELLLDAGANPNHLSTLHRSPLLEAIENNHESIIDILLKFNDLDVNLRAPGRRSGTALTKAAQLGSSKHMEKLLTHKNINVNKPDNSNCTALARAVRSLNISCMTLLLDHDQTDLTTRDIIDERTALDWTADDSLDYEEHSTEIDAIAKALISDRRQVKASNKSIIQAIYLRRLGLLKIFIQAGLDHSYVDKHGRDFLHLAAVNGDCDIVQVVYMDSAAQPSFDINRTDNYKSTALHAACANLTYAHVETIGFLLTHGADPSLRDHEGMNPVQKAQLAAFELWSSCVKDLFDPYVTTMELENVSSSPTVNATVRSADLETLKAILHKSSDRLDPETDLYTHSTILHMTMDLPADDRPRFLELLLPRSKHFINAKNSFERTCVHIAVMRICLPSLKLLIAAGANLNIKDKWNKTATQLAQDFHLYEMYIFLVKNGAELPVSEEIGSEMLHAAVKFGELTAVTRLVEAGIDTLYRDPATQTTALQLATEQWEKAIHNANDDLLLSKQTQYWDDRETFNKAKLSAPEVVKHEKIMNYLRNVQKHTIKPRSECSSLEDFSKLITKLKTLDPKQILDITLLEQELNKSAPLEPLPALPRYEDVINSGSHKDMNKYSRRGLETKRMPDDPIRGDRSVTISINIGREASIVAVLILGLAVIIVLLR